jgi:hypothetical protein
MKMTTAKRVAAIATSAALMMAVPGTAFAQTEIAEPGVAQTDRTAGIDQLKRRALEAIDTRLEAITRWTGHVETADHLSAEHRAALLAELGAAARGLDDLAVQITAAETYSELGTLIPKIVEDYWVFALLGPKVHLVVAADVMAHVGERFEEVAGSIQGAINRIEEAGYDPAGAQAALDRMQAHLVAAATLITPVPDSVLDLQPADMPEAGAQLRNARADLESAGEELRAARQAGRDAVAAIRDAIGQ